jgi:hypothetical protein
MASSAHGLLILLLIGCGGAVRGFFCLLFDGSGDSFIGGMAPFSGWPGFGGASIPNVSSFPLLRHGKIAVSRTVPLRKGRTPRHPRWMFCLRCCWWRHLLVPVASISVGGGGFPFPSCPHSVSGRFSFNVFDSSRRVL